MTDSNGPEVAPLGVAGCISWTTIKPYRTASSAVGNRSCPADKMWIRDSALGWIVNTEAKIPYNVLSYE